MGYNPWAKLEVWESFDQNRLIGACSNPQLFCEHMPLPKVMILHQVTMEHSTISLNHSLNYPRWKWVPIIICRSSDLKFNFNVTTP